MRQWYTLSLLIVCMVAVFGAGIADVVFTDVVPIRPYTIFFQAILSPQDSLAFEHFHFSLSGIIGVLALTLLAVSIASGITLPSIFPVIIGHGASEVSHNKWRSKSTKRIVAKKILKSIRRQGNA